VGGGGRTEEDVRARSEAVAREFDLPDFHSSVVRADSVDAAVTAEVARGYDLVFLGLGRSRALSHRLLRALLASGHSDVVLVRAAGGAGRFRRILVPMTGTTPSRAAVELAFLYAGETRAHLQVLHVIDGSAAPDRRARAELRLLGARMLEELVARGRREGVDVRCRLVSSRHPARAILDAAVDERADLVLLGATPRYLGRRAFFGPTTEGVLARAPCAVAVYAGGVRPEAFRAAAPEPVAAPPPGAGEDGAASPPGSEGAEAPR
jgi:nucleotide-binding universal stress UspA family protein